LLGWLLVLTCRPLLARMGVGDAAPFLDRTLFTVKELTKHPNYHAKNPNNIYALIGGFAMANQVGVV
jgi:hypothetical protein